MRTFPLAALVLAISTGTLVAQVSTPPTGQRPAQPPKPATPSPAPGAPATSQPAAQAPAVRRTPPKPTPMRLVIRDQRGAPLGDVHVAVLGPGDRSVVTGADGRAELPAMPDGAYRLRFDREGFFTLERDIVLKNPPSAEISVALDLAPPPPPPPAPAPAPPAPEPPKPAADVPPGPPVYLSIPTFIDRNFIGRDPVKESMVSCTAGAMTRVLQIRDPVTEHAHADADEILYVVAGEGAVRVKGTSTAVTAGALTVLPRGTAHAVERSGRNPLIMISILSGVPCPKAGQ